MRATSGKPGDAGPRPLRIRSLLVPLDGSGFAEQAIPWAATLARAARARLRLVLVHQPPEPPPSDRESRRLYVRIELALRKSQRDYLRTVAARVKAEGLTQVTSATLSGSPAPAPAIAAYAAEVGVDLVVMTTHGRGGLERAWLGSVADQLVRSLEIPVLLIRPVEGAVSPPEAREILVALDGSRRAEAALPPAMAMAGLLRARLTLLQAVAPVVLKIEAQAAFVGSFDEPLSSLRRDEAKDYLEDIASQVTAAGVEARPTAVLAANPVEAIRAAAASPDVGMIAVATHGRTGLRRMVLGSVADKLVRTSELPMLVTRPRGR